MLCAIGQVPRLNGALEMTFMKYELRSLQISLVIVHYPLNPSIHVPGSGLTSDVPTMHYIVCEQSIFLFDNSLFSLEARWLSG